LPAAPPSSTYSRLPDTNASRPCPPNALAPTTGPPAAGLPTADTLATVAALSADPAWPHAATARTATASAATEAASLVTMNL